MPEMHLFLWYMAGALLHVGWRWSGWKSHNPERRWIDYWSRHAALNIQALLVAIALAFVWTQGLVWWALEQAGFTQVPHFQATILSSISVGFFAEMLYARVASRLSAGKPTPGAA